MWNDFLNELTPQMWQLVASSTVETIYMGFVATLLSVVIGLPIGFFAFLTGKGEILENQRAHQILDIIINIGRSVPFIIPAGLTEAAKSMGATNWQVVTRFYLPESLPILINGITLTLVALIGYSAMAGAVGGGGLGNLAISYGEHRNMVYVKWIATVIIVAIVMISQKLGDHLAKKYDHR